MSTSTPTSASQPPAVGALACARAQSDLRTLIERYNWEKTCLGPIAQWSPRLRAIIDLILDSAEPMVIWWGPDRLQIYNDAYATRVDVIVGSRALGRPAAETWKHGWTTIEPLIERVFADGTSHTYHDFPFDMERNGQVVETYWTYSLNPLRDDDHVVQGVLMLSSEVTERTLLTRRQHTLDVLRSDLADASSFGQLSAAAGRAAALNAADLFRVTLTPHNARGPAAAGGATPPVRVQARYVGIDVDLAIEFVPSSRVALNDSYRIFVEQFCLLVASSQQRIEGEAARRIMEAERDRLLLDAPVGAAVMMGENLIYHLVNAVYAAVSGRPAREMVNKSFVEVYPELLGSPVHQKFLEVYRSGEPFVSEPTLVQIHRNGGALDDRYFTYNLSPLRKLTGEVVGLMVIAVDITTEVESRSHVERLNVELEAAARAKDEFLAMLAHELRNPLAPIGAAAELLQIAQLDEKTVRRTSAVIGRQVRHMTALVDDLLDVSRLTRGLVDLHMQALEIRQVVNDAVEQVAPLIQARRHHLDMQLPASATNVSADRERLIQVVANILNNAAKYTPEGGHIQLSVEALPEQVVIAVADNGIGMESDLALHAFDLFAQAQRTPDRSSGGLGLGLALVKNLTELHGGQVSCRSDGTGKGSTFYVRLPRQPAGDDAPDEAHGQRDGAPQAHALRILVVDDNEDAAAMMALLLESSGHHAMVEFSSAGALERAKHDRPQVCILDIGLPDMDGIELANRLLAAPETAHCVLIAATGYGQQKDLERTKAAGFSHHLVKPVDIQALLALLAQIAAGPPTLFDQVTAPKH